MQLIDTHVHVNFDRFSSDIDVVRQRWQQAGVAKLVHSCVEPGEFKSILALCQRYPEISLAVGLHPLDVDQWQSSTASTIETLARGEPKVVAIGETGLDLYKAENLEAQTDALLAQLEIASSLHKPVIIHCRDAAVELKERLQAFMQTKTIKGVMHCWGGDWEETKWFLDLGFYISYSGIVTFKSAKQVQLAAAQVPGDRLLIETDCPFLAPVPMRGKRNEPSYVVYVAQKLAELRQVPIEQLAQQTTQNACKLFNLNLEENQAA